MIGGTDSIAPEPTVSGDVPPPGPPDSHREAVIRQGCHGLPPVAARMEPWQLEALSRPQRLQSLVKRHGSPLHLHAPAPFERNVKAFRAAVEERGLEVEIFFARKANRALAYVDRARSMGIGVDTASEEELTQCLDRGLPPTRLLSTAAVKTEALVHRCVQAGVAVVVDNRDELDRVAWFAGAAGSVARVVIRVSGFTSDGTELTSRFGFHRLGVAELGAELTRGALSSHLVLEGLHFHLDGYSAAHRTSGITQCLPLVDALREQGHPIRSLDIGGGMPMSYVDDPKQWTAFKGALREALQGYRPPITHGNRGFGWTAADGRVSGELKLYPYAQDPVGPRWLAGILDGPLETGGGTVAGALRARGLVLRLEPGRSALDGCGMTVARVEHRKRHGDGSWSVGLCMNRSQCASGKPDHAVDPLLLPTGGGGPARTPPIEGFLTGTYCTESDLITWRRLRFPLGVARGDLLVFLNTAGYLMHFVESRAHQFPLAMNLVASPDLEEVRSDPVEAAIRHP